ncbi:DUF4350 domain-containing protein [Methanoregula sp.]|uniref:DUF4350 domain-containing protein n=1 Tax=Methanoregula sp. TaxID=2052170 RepID=UPI0035672629
MTIIKAEFWFSGLVLLFAILILFGHLTTNNQEFSRYNTAWNGTSQFFSDLDRDRVVEISGPDQLSAYPANATLLIIAPVRLPTDEEQIAYRTFIERGNTIILADDFGTGNATLKAVGSRISIQPLSLSSVDREFADAYSIVVYPVTNETPVKDVNKLLLNHPAPLNGGNTLVRTSVMSWIDANSDRRISKNEMLSTFAVISSEKISKGRIIVISDPSLFINSMYAEDNRWDNRLFIRNLVNEPGPVLIDQMNSRTRDAEGLNEILHVIRTNVIIELIIFAGLLLLVAGVWKTKRI